MKEKKRENCKKKKKDHIVPQNRTSSLSCTGIYRAWYLCVLSIFKTIIESFFLLNSMGEVREFIGFENYINIFSNSKFIQSIFNSIKFAVFTVPFTVGLSFILAMMAAKKRKASPVYETLFSLPMAMSTSVAAMIFELMFSYTGNRKQHHRPEH